MTSKSQKTIGRKLTSIILVALMVISMFPFSTLAASNQLIKDGMYALVPACAPNKCLDICNSSTVNGANAQIYSSNYYASANQRFYIVSAGNNYYNILVDSSGKALDVHNGSSSSGSNVQQYEYNNTNAQKWSIKSAGNGYYYISPKTNKNLNLDVRGAYNLNNTNVQVYTANGTAAQKWKLVSLVYSKQTKNYLFNSPMTSLAELNFTKPIVYTVTNNTGKSATLTIRGYMYEGIFSSPYRNANVDATVVIKDSSGKTISTTKFNNSTKKITVPSKYTRFTVSIFLTDHGKFFNSAYGWGINEGTFVQMQLGNARLVDMKK